jgi:hypothetical protein
VSERSEAQVVVLPSADGVLTASYDGAIVAASRPLMGSRGEDPARNRSDWQNEAWDFYDGPDGEALRYGISWVANLVSKAKLRAARVVSGETDPEIIEEGPAADAVEELAGGVDGQAQLLRAFAVQLAVAGIGYLVGSDALADDLSGGSSWRVVSQDVIRMKQPATPTSPAIYELAYDEGAWRQLPPEGTMVVKFWRPHARFFWRPDSPTHSAIGALRELRRINQYIDATLVSRLAGAGILVFPSEARFPTAPTETQGQHPFVTEVMQVMMTAVKQPGTAAQIVPIPVEVPAEYVDSFKLINWSTELSDKILEMRESAQKRVATALDVPAEVVMGMGDMNHWGAWQIEESAITVHAEPLLQLITGDLTRSYLHPLLEAMGEDTEGIVLVADTSDLKVQPDKTKPAMDLYDRGELGGDSLRREQGFAESDAPDDEELASWAFKKLLSNPQLAPGALDGLGIKVPESMKPAPPPEPIDVASPEASGSPDTPPEADAAEKAMPDTEGDTPSTPSGAAPQRADLARVLVLEGHVRRALEVARNRMKGGSKTDPLGGVFTHALETLSDVGYDPVVTVSKLTGYCRTVLSSDTAYDRSSLVRFMNDEVDCADCSQ